MGLTAMHKGILIGLILGVIATWVWHRRQAGGAPPEG
jgi:hypothetical protein